MSRRRPRVELSAIATLDADVACARQQCEDNVRLAYEELLQRKDAAKASFHDRYLENLRVFFESEAAAAQISTRKWPEPSLQTFLGRFFSIYRDRDAFDGICAVLRAEGASYGVENGRSWIEIESFDVLKRALYRDTAARIPIHKPQPQQSIVLARSEGYGPDGPSIRRGSSRVGLPSDSETSSVAFSSETDLHDDAPDAVPANSVLVATELRVEVQKKSQNWLGRWRSRHLSLRWNELEMRKGRSASGSGTGAAGHNRHSLARSFPSQPAVPTGYDLNVIASGSSSTKIKRYALQNLLSLQLIQLNESESTRKLALDLHFKQAAANGHGFTTKSLIVTSDKPSAKDLMAKIATLALFRGLVAGDLKAPMLEKLVQAGANVNAFCAIPVPTRVVTPATTLCPLQLVFLQFSQSADASRDGALAVWKMLLAAKADPRSLFHWHFARRVLLSSESPHERALEAVFFLLEDSWVTAFGSDAYGWSLLMYASRMADVARVSELLQRVENSLSTPEEVLNYVQHVNGDGETALHIAIRAARGERATCAEDVALLIVEACASESQAVSGRRKGANAPFSSDSDGESLVHLAIKAKLWRLVDCLLKHVPIVSDGGSTQHPVHLAIRSGAPSGVVAAILQHMSGSLDGDLIKSALALAVACGRDDIVAVLGHNAGASVYDINLNGDESLLSQTIQKGMASAARSIWLTTSANTSSSSRIELSTLVVQAVERGMYRLAHEIATSSPSLHVEASGESRIADAVGLAIHAGELELASTLLDAVASQLPWERILKALLSFSTDENALLGSEEDQLGMFTSRCIEDTFAGMLSLADVIDEAEAAELLQAVCGLRRGLNRRLLVLFLSFLRFKDSTAIAHLITEPDCVTGWTPVHTALSNHDLSSALQLLHEVLPKSKDAQDDEFDGLHWIESPGTTLLHLACQWPLSSDALVTTELLLQNDAYASTWDSHGFSPLHVAIQHKCDARMVQIFAKHEQDLNIWSEATVTVRCQSPGAAEVALPLTPLMTAVESSNVIAFRELLRCGADLRAKTPTTRLGLLQFAARVDGVLSREMLEALVSVKAYPSTEPAEERAKSELRDRLSRLEEPPVCASDAVDALLPVVADDNRVLRITLLGLQTPTPPFAPPDVIDTAPILTTPPLSPARPSLSPPRSPSRRSFLESEPRRGSGRHIAQRQSREPSPVRQLGDDSLGFLHDEEKATLMLVAQEARTEAQEWLKKRSGQKKMLSEARALLQNGRDGSHRRTPSGTVVASLAGLEKRAPVVVTDEQLLETHKALAAKQFIDKHVAEAVNEARAAIEREKMTIFQSTGIFPGEMFPSHPGRPKDASVGSSSSSSTLRTPRTASMNSSMLLLFSGSENDTFLSEASGSGRGGAYRKGSAVDDEVLNPLERESFVHLADARRSLF